VDLRPYVQYNAPLNPGQSVTMILKFYVPDRKPFTNTLEAIEVPQDMVGTNAATGVLVDRVFMDTRIAGDTRFVLEFSSIPGRVYTVLYSDDLLTWRAMTPSITASSNRTQVYDDGPPETISKPLSTPHRYYQVLLAPANP
jgi:hypothetical protein